MLFFQAMFPETDAIQYDSEDVKALQEFLSEASSYPPTLTYSIKIQLRKVIIWS